MAVVLSLEITNICDNAYRTRCRNSSLPVSDCCQKASCTKLSSALFCTKSAALHFTSPVAQGGLFTISACSTAGSDGTGAILNCSVSQG